SAAWAVQRLLQRVALDVAHLLFALAEARLKDAGTRASLAKQYDVADELCRQAFAAESRNQCALIRDVFGNPFRTVAFSPEWRTDTAVALARQMYEGYEFSAMPILADALQDAGCDSADILNHCRGEGSHVRGCWVVDLVLGKE